MDTVLFSTCEEFEDFCLRCYECYMSGDLFPYSLRETYRLAFDTWEEAKDELIEHGVDGFNIYHYWFKDGHKVLEKPAEILLNHPEIDIEFFFSWDNTSWVRSWSNIAGNNWAPSFDREIKQDKPVLLLDDVLSELDSNRQKFLLESISDIQTIITCTGLDDFVNNRFDVNKVFNIVDGNIFINNIAV